MGDEGRQRLQEHALSIQATRAAAYCAAAVALAACQSSPPTEALNTGEISRFAFGSCAFQWEEQPIWDDVLAVRPDVFVFAGDAIYGDYDGERVYEVTVESLTREWAKLEAQPGFRQLRENAQVIGTWDNHDYGHHSAGAEFPLKEESKELFLDVFPASPGSKVRGRPGIYRSYGRGPSGRLVQFILLDTRTFKSPPRLAERSVGSGGSLGKYAPNDDPEATLLGEAQWAWLEEQLTGKAALRVIVSSGQVLPDEKGMDEWGNYPLERQRLLDLIEASGATGVLLLSGNVHFAEISRLDGGRIPLIEFTSSGLTHVEPKYAEAPNRLRIAGPFADLNFGLVEVDWNALGGPVVTLSAIGLGGDVAFETSFALDELGARHRPGQ